MRHVRWYTVLSCLFLAACGKAGDQPITGESSQRILAGSSTPLFSEGLHEASLWNGVKQSPEWTAAVLSVVRERFNQFELASDANEFCPGYTQASISQKEACWVRLVSAMSKFESGFNPRETYREKTGQMSIGMLSLSPGECPEARSAASLKEAIPNLVCGTRMMANLIARDGVIENPSPRRGAAAYWSVLRSRYGSGKHTHGRKDQIISLTREYKVYQPI